MHVYRAMYGAVVLLCVGDLWEPASGLATFKEIVISPIFNGSFIFSHYMAGLWRVTSQVCWRKGI